MIWDFSFYTGWCMRRMFKMNFTDRFICLGRSFAIDPRASDQLINNDSQSVYVSCRGKWLRKELLRRQIEGRIFGIRFENLFAKRSCNRDTTQKDGALFIDPNQFGSQIKM